MKQINTDAMMEAKEVASFAGAWIETPFGLFPPIHRLVASFAGAWIETGACRIRAHLSGGRLLRGGVD